MPYAESWLALEQASGGRSALIGTPEELRQGWSDISKVIYPLWPEASPNVSTKDEKLNGVPCRIYTLKNAKPRALGVWTHGGGWTIGDLDMDDAMNRIICEKAEVTIVSIDYRLSPESKWPAQLDDCMAVFKWVYANQQNLGIDSNRIFTFGLSAGGELALAIANQVKKDPQLKDGLKGVAALVPVTAHYDNVPEKYKSQYKSYEENEKGVPILEKAGMVNFFKFAAVKPDDASCFTLLATDTHKDFPPTYFVSCEKDPLRDDAFIMEQALKDAGVPTKHDHYKGLPHYFWAFATLPETQTYTSNLVKGIDWLISQM